MKVAIASNDKIGISHHFGRAQGFIFIGYLFNMII